MGTFVNEKWASVNRCQRGRSALTAYVTSSTSRSRPGSPYEKGGSKPMELSPAELYPAVFSTLEPGGRAAAGTWVATILPVHLLHYARQHALHVFRLHI